MKILPVFFKNLFHHLQLKNGDNWNIAPTRQSNRAPIAKQNPDFVDVSISESEYLTLDSVLLNHQNCSTSHLEIVLLLISPLIYVHLSIFYLWAIIFQIETFQTFNSNIPAFRVNPKNILIHQTTRLALTWNPERDFRVSYHHLI